MISIVEDENVVLVPQSVWLDADYRIPTMYYIVNAFGELVCFRTGKREKAQSMSDSIYGKGKYNVRARSIK